MKKIHGSQDAKPLSDEEALLKDIFVTNACASDIPMMNQLSYEKRRAYEMYHPEFWRWAGEKGEKAQCDWFHALIKKKDAILLVAKKFNVVKGFIIGQLLPAPAVYNPNGLTLLFALTVRF